MMRESHTHLDLLLLATLKAQPAHGYAVIEALRRRSDGVFDLPEATVYPALHRLEREGFLAGEWTEVGGRRRCTYRLTPRGKAALGERRRQWMAWTRGMNGALEGAS